MQYALKNIKVDGEGLVTSVGNNLHSFARRLEQVFPFGEDDGVICAYSESDWVG